MKKTKCKGITSKGTKCKILCVNKYCKYHCKGGAFRMGKQRKTTPRLHYAPIVPGIKENKAMRGW